MTVDAVPDRSFHQANLPSAQIWVQKLEEEFYLQGDLELHLGHSQSPLMDRTKAGVTKAQVGGKIDQPTKWLSMYQ